MWLIGVCHVYGLNARERRDSTRKHRTELPEIGAVGGSSSRVSTAGSSGTIGWAGPWVSTHRQGGVDRMYPAHLRLGTTGPGSQMATPKANLAQASTCQWHFDASQAAPAAPGLSGASATRNTAGRLHKLGEQRRGGEAQACPTQSGVEHAVSDGSQRSVGTPIERLSALRLKSRQGLRRTRGREGVHVHGDAPPAPEQSVDKLRATARRTVHRPQWCSDTHVAGSTDSETSPERSRAPSAKTAAQQAAHARSKAVIERRQAAAAAVPRARMQPADVSDSFDEVPAVAQGLAAGAQMPRETGQEDAERSLQRCPTCSRSFRPEALARHAGVCSKVFAQKRKAFDSKSMRTPEGVDALVPSNRGRGKGRQQQAPSAAPPRHEDRLAQGALGKASSWKQKSEMFRAAMRANRCDTWLAERRSTLGCRGNARLNAMPPSKPGSEVRVQRSSSGCDV